MKHSTNALTKRYCEMKGWPSQCVQTFYGGRRHDLFGIADTIILHPAGEIWVQNASYGTLKAHRAKIDASEHIRYVDLQGVPVEIWEWKRKKIGRKKSWFLRRQAREGMGWSQVSEWDGPLDL